MAPPLTWVRMIWLLLVPPAPGLLPVKLTVVPALRIKLAMVSVEGRTVPVAGVTVMVLAPPEPAPPVRVTAPTVAALWTPV